MLCFYITCCYLLNVGKQLFIHDVYHCFIANELLKLKSTSDIIIFLYKRETNIKV